MGWEEVVVVVVVLVAEGEVVEDLVGYGYGFAFGSDSETSRFAMPVSPPSM